MVNAVLTQCFSKSPPVDLGLSRSPKSDLKHEYVIKAIPKGTKIISLNRIIYRTPKRVSHTEPKAPRTADVEFKG
jgi:hypothetical protein